MKQIQKNWAWLLLGALLLAGLLALFWGCSGNKAGDLFETAKLEELQNNPVHAIELYEEIVRKYPTSEVAEKARQRLKVLQ